MTKDTLKSDEKLQNGERLTSQNGYYEAVMQGDGNFVLYFTPCSYPLWSSGTQDKGPDCWVAMQGDGNLVIYPSSGGTPGTALWSSDSNGSGCFLVMQDDGNLVLYQSGGGAPGTALWSTGTANGPNPFPDHPHVLYPENELHSGYSLVSLNGLYSAAMQGDGNFVVYFNPCGLHLWDSKTDTKNAKGYFIVMQNDGNLVIYSSGVAKVENSKWSSHTAGKGPGCFLVMQDDGNLVLYQGSNHWWDSHTDKKPEYFYKDDNEVHFRIDWGDLCLNLAKGLAGALPDSWAYGGAIGAVLLDKIFPDKSQEIDYDKLISYFANIVEEKIKEGFTADEMANVNTAKDYMQGEYSHDKKTKSKSALLDELSQTILIGKINPALNLIDEYSDDSKMALGCYIYAVNLKISIRQEMALIDNPDIPNNSDYAGLIKDELKNKHIPNAKKIYDGIKAEIEGNRQNHLGQITNVKNRSKNDYYSEYYFEDNYLHFSKGGYEYPDGHASQDDKAKKTVSNCNEYLFLSNRSKL